MVFLIACKVRTGFSLRADVCSRVCADPPCFARQALCIAVDCKPKHHVRPLNETATVEEGATADAAEGDKPGTAGTAVTRHLHTAGTQYGSFASLPSTASLQLIPPVFNEVCATQAL